MKKLKHYSKMGGIMLQDKEYIQDGYCALVMIVDRSGSMGKIREDAIGGFNVFLEEQKKVPGDAVITTVFFNSKQKTVHNWVPLQTAKPLTTEDYVPSGSTSLNDTLCKTITDIGIRINSMNRSDKPKKVIVGILTDGEENSSCEYTTEQVKEMIEHQKSVYSWEFHYLAANQDAFLVGNSIGLDADNICSFVSTASGTRKAYRDMSARYLRSRK